LAAWADLPDPPDELKSRRLPILEFPVQSNQQLFRCHKRTRGPIYFNRTEGRFGPPDGASFGMCYFGMDAGCAFLEGLMDHVADGTTGAVVSMSLIRQRCICAVTSSSMLRLVNLTDGRSLKSIHAKLDSRIADCSHDKSQAWAHAFWSHPDEPDGIVYRARNGPERYAVALFDRVEGDLKH